MGFAEAFKEFPQLETERVLLRKLELNDATSMFEYFSKDEVTEFYDLETFTSMKQAEELIERLLLRYSSGQQIRWGIVLKENRRFIGTCGFHEIEEEHFKAEIGYELHPDFWRSGIMTEVICKVVEYGFEKMEFNRIEAFFDPSNIASGRVLEKNGFHLEGILKKRFYEKGKFVDAAIAATIK